MKARRYYFGEGKVVVCGAAIPPSDKATVLVIGTVEESHPIGAEVPDDVVTVGEKTTEAGMKLVTELRFTKPESVQVVIDALEDIKSDLEKG